MTGTASSIQIRGNGFAALPANVNLIPAGSGVYVNLGLSVTLPGAGTYQLDATVRAAIGTMTTGENAYIVARLFDATTGVVVPNSEVLAIQIIVGAGTSATLLSWNLSSPIQIEYPVTSARTVRMEAAYFTASGTTDSASVVSDGNGRTTLRYRRVA